MALLGSILRRFQTGSRAKKVCYSGVTGDYFLEGKVTENLSYLSVISVNLRMSEVASVPSRVPKRRA
jgi:hypothetical protein